MPARAHPPRGMRCFPVILQAAVLPAVVLVLTATRAYALPLVEQGEPRAVLVTADEPSPVARYAAEELAHHVEKATGAALPIVGESQAPVEGRRHVYIGVTQAAAEQGVRPDELPPDALLLRSVGHDLYVLGVEDDREPMDQSARSGTLYGVYELLHRYVGVRWLWPGDLGTHIPRSDTLRLPDDLDEVVEPALRFRRFRTHRVRWQASNYNATLGRLAFSEQGSRDYDTDLQVYLRRHRVGDTAPKPPVGHYFAGWWERYGEEHPEWFMMRADGQRGPEPDARGADDQSPSPQRHVAMCVSNADLHRYIVEHAWDGGPYLRLGEVDRRVFCQCESCLAWDGPQPEEPPHVARNLYRPQVVTDRYARFWKTVQQMARQRNPDVVVTTFLYWNYLPVPTSGIELNEHIYGEYVPWGQSEVTYFPMSEEAYAWNEQQWKGWHETGITMAYRPNYFHGGYVMPHLSTWQVAEFFQFAYRHGMIGFDQDSLYGHWATRGPMLYLHMRLAAEPEADIAELRREYFAAFGPAAGHVERYFDYWEEYAQDRPGGALATPVNAAIAYPAEVFPPAKRILAEAMEAARQDDLPEYARRVAFLESGLEHARLTARFIGLLDRGRAPDDAQQLAEARAALGELIAFRREHEHLYIADYLDASRRENRWLDIDALLSDDDEGPDAACKNLLPDKIAGAYSGWFSPHATGSLDELAETVLDPMAKAGFNTWYHKIQPSGNRRIDLSDPAQFERVRLLAEACQERGLALVAYTYHYPHGHRDPKRYGSFVLDYPPLVTADGTVLENRFAMANWDTWLLITNAVFELAEASLKLPIAAVGSDHEHFGRGTISYDDEAWADFAAERGLDASLAPEARGRFVNDQNLKDAYEEWYHRRWDDIVQRWVEKIHGINPHLSIAIMPQNGRKNWFGMPFFRHAGTEKAPAVMDCWHLYNGSGLTEAVKRIHETIKEFNPHNRHVQWFRPDSYRTSDLRVHAYHALWELDGYSNWHVGQITGADDPEEYWQAYRDANRAALRDIAAGIDEPSVPLEPVTPVVAPMPELDDPVPQLVPRGDGSGDDQWIPMRNLRQVLIYARADEELRGEVHHRAGAARPLALHYRLVHPDGSWLYDNSVMPGETGSFSVRATETGTYALYVTGGMGGQAWYAVRIHNPWHAVPFEFGDPYIFYQRRLFPLTLWLQRRDSDAAASLRIHGSGIQAQAGDGPPMAGRDFTLVLPAGDAPIPVRFSRPQPGNISGPWHPQNIHLGAEGAVFPYLGVAPERMLLPGE